MDAYKPTRCASKRSARVAARVSLSLERRSSSRTTSRVLYAICLSPSGYRTGCDLSPFSGKETIAALMQVNGSDAAHLLHRYLEFRDLVPAAFTAIALSPSPNE